MNERDGLALGICNGFQALIKLGLVPNGADRRTGYRCTDTDLQYDWTSYLQDGIYKSGIQTNPHGLQQAELGGVYTNPASHGEGRFVANEGVAYRNSLQTDR